MTEVKRFGCLFGMKSYISHENQLLGHEAQFVINYGAWKRNFGSEAERMKSRIRVITRC